MTESLPNSLYVFAMLLAASGWVFLILAPRRPWANFWYGGLLAPALLAATAILALAVYWFQPPAGSVSAFGTFDGLSALLWNKGLLAALWANLLAMELAVGAWMARKAAQIRMPLTRLIPCLLLAAVFAGFGFLLFWTMTALAGGWPEVARFEEQPPVNTLPVAARPTVGRPVRSGALFG